MSAGFLAHNPSASTHRHTVQTTSFSLPPLWGRVGVGGESRRAGIPTPILTFTHHGDETRRNKTCPQKQLKISALTLPRRRPTNKSPVVVEIFQNSRRPSWHWRQSSSCLSSLLPCSRRSSA